jgi:AAA family ATP:ADP antiporter
VRSRLPPGVDGWGYSLKGMMGMVVVGGLLITGTYWLLQRTVVPTCAPPSNPSTTLKPYDCLEDVLHIKQCYWH